MAPMTTYALSTIALLVGASQAAPTLTCPTINGESDAICGLACYSEHMYNCTSGTLQLLPAVPGPFTLTAENPTAPFNGKSIEASGGSFFIGKGPTTYCPTPEVPAADCPAGNTTVFAVGDGESGLDVEVPGSQFVYIEVDGSLAFTQAHSGAEPDFSSSAISAYDGSLGGGYYGPNGLDWLACPVANATGVYQVFADYANVTSSSSCTGFYAIVHDLANNASSLGAWEYI